MRQHSRKNFRTRRGAAAVLAMLFLVLFTTLTLAMFSLATGNVQTASNLSDVQRAQGASESGIRWIAYRFLRMPRPRTTSGTISPSVMDTLWPEIQQAIIDDMVTGPNRMLNASERAWTSDATAVVSPPISVESTGATFELDIRQSADPTVMTVTSTGRYRNAARSVAMSFKVDKKVKFAIVGKVPIQIGRNTIVEGPVAMTSNVANKDPLLMLSDFMHFDDQLKARLEGWNAFLQEYTVVNGQSVPNHSGYDNRISLNNQREAQLAQSAGFTDVNGDAYIDEYDFFVERFDADHDLRVTRAEFTDPATGLLYEENLFAAIDMIGAPMFSGDIIRQGYLDGVIDNSDGYAKIRGNVALAKAADVWGAELANRDLTINDMVQGTIIPTDPTQPAIKFGATIDEMIDTDPANFEQAALGFKARTGAAGGTPVNTATRKENIVLTAAMANAGTVDERTPFGSTSWQATYRRPQFSNMTFKNVQIPKGLNALFDNCTFEGVTWVEGERDIPDPNTGQPSTSPSHGKTWAQKKVSGDNFSNTKVLLSSGTPTSGQTITEGSKKGNNLRFNNCTMKGPLAGNYATAYTHFANSWEFTGATMFDNQVDQTATIVSPQVNIEMGSFTNPGDAPSTMIGVVVAGNIDVRGTSNVDGSIIITGDGAGNTTLAYFGASDSSTDPNAPMPEGGWGRLNIRYNPTRTLPDGINLAVDILPEAGSYCEVMQCAN